MTIPKDAQAIVAALNKKHGDGAVVTASDLVVPERFTSGSLGLDIILGGGWPTNQWVEILGKESQGKTAIILKTIAANQARDPNFTVVWIAAEHYDTDQAAALGVDNSRVIVVPTQEMEVAFETLLEFAESKTVDMGVLDSYPALIPSEEAQKSMEDSVVAVGARLTGKFFRKAGGATRRVEGERPFLGVVINQWRDQIGGFSPHGTPQTSPGGNAKNYAYYVRLDVKRDEFIDELRPGKGKQRVGQVIKLTTRKNKSAAPGQMTSVRFFFRDAPRTGFRRGEYDLVEELVTYGTLYDKIIRRGAYYTIGERRWGPGKDQLLEDLRHDVELQQQLRSEILEAASRPDHEIFGAEDAG
ncbi:hypothetical protein AB0K16_22365 [Nonomuraea jabiensis]|uniref:hypothetical protein n=1 Tax=Nonomuraea jabiensis TaxID=882448 RepID=UPI00343A4F74